MRGLWYSRQRHQARQRMVMGVVLRNLRLRRKDREKERAMNLADVLHYLSTIKDLVHVVETDDPGLGQHLKNMSAVLQEHMDRIKDSGSIEGNAEEKVGEVVQAVKDAAPSANTQPSSPSPPAPVEVKPVE